jgi:hypothetical protein
MVFPEQCGVSQFPVHVFIGLQLLAAFFATLFGGHRFSFFAFHDFGFSWLVLNAIAWFYALFGGKEIFYPLEYEFFDAVHFIDPFWDFMALR